MLTDSSSASRRQRAQNRSGTHQARPVRAEREQPPPRPALALGRLDRAREDTPASALLRARISSLAWLGGVVSAITGCSAVLVQAWAPQAHWLRQLAIVQLFGVTLFCGIGLYARRSSRARALPSGVDSALGLSATLILLGSIWQLPREVRPDLIAMAFALCIVLASAVMLRLAHRGREKAKEARQLGQYALVHRIGGGGMGIVYEAEHTSLRRRTAVKVLTPERAGEQSLVRFEREARLTASLCHPNTVRVYDYGRTAAGTFYYAMEYIEGIDLDLLVRHDGPQHPGRVIQIISQICGALAEAHALGLIHQDIKPANVFLCERAGMVDVVKVLDFGLVRNLGEGSPDLDEAARGQFSGTPNYIAPEAILGAGEVDGRTDIYAVGCLAHYLLTGAPPFSGNTVLEVLGQHLHATPKRFAEHSPWPLSQELEQVVLSCLGKARVQRPSDTATLYTRLQACPEATTWDAMHGRHWWAERGASLRARLAAARGEDP